MTARGASPMVRAMVVVCGSSATAVVLGFVKNAMAAYYFDCSGEMDSYLIALLLPDTVMQLARTGAFNFIPLFGAARERSEAEAWRAAGKMVTFWLLLLTVILALALFTAPAAMPLLAPGFSGAGRHETLELTRVLLLMAASLGAGRILGVVLHAQKRFVVAGASEVLFQIGSMAFVVAFQRVGIAALAWSQVFGGCLQLLVCALALLPHRRQLRAGVDVTSSPMRKLMRLSLPVYLADSGDKVNQMVGRSFASFLPTGAVSSLQYAYFPVEGIHRMLASSMFTALFPFLANLFSQSDRRKERASLSQAIVSSTALFLPLTAVVWLLADPLVALMFQRGSFDAASTARTASALRLFAPSIFALALNELLGSAFHARQDTMTPMWAGFVRIACHIALCMALIPVLGYGGLALSATLALYVKLGMLAWLFRRVFAPGEAHRTLREVAQIGLAVGVMVAMLYPLAALASALQVFQSHVMLSLGAGSVLCLAAYTVALRLLARRQFLVHAAGARRAMGRRRPAPRPRRVPLLTPPLAAEPVAA